MTCFTICFFFETKEVSSQIHKTIHWLILSHQNFLFVFNDANHSVSRWAGWREVCVWGGVYVCRGGWFCHDSSAWIKCGTLIWVKIMESYMSLTMSAFHNGQKWKVTAACDGGRGGQRFWNGNQVTTRPSLWLTLSQAEPGLTVTKRQAAKNLHPPIFCLCLPVSLGDIAVKAQGQRWVCIWFHCGISFIQEIQLKGQFTPVKKEREREKTLVWLLEMNFLW